MAAMNTMTKLCYLMAFLATFATATDVKIANLLRARRSAADSSSEASSSALNVALSGKGDPPVNKEATLCAAAPLFVCPSSETCSPSMSLSAGKDPYMKSQADASINAAALGKGYVTSIITEGIKKIPGVGPAGALFLAPLIKIALFPPTGDECQTSTCTWEKVSYWVQEYVTFTLAKARKAALSKLVEGASTVCTDIAEQATLQGASLSLWSQVQAEILVITNLIPQFITSDANAAQDTGEDAATFWFVQYVSIQLHLEMAYYFSGTISDTAGGKSNIREVPARSLAKLTTMLDHFSTHAATARDLVHNAKVARMHQIKPTVTNEGANGVYGAVLPTYDPLYDSYPTCVWKAPGVGASAFTAGITDPSKYKINAGVSWTETHYGTTSATWAWCDRMKVAITDCHATHTTSIQDTIDATWDQLVLQPVALWEEEVEQIKIAAYNLQNYDCSQITTEEMCNDKTVTRSGCSWSSEIKPDSGTCVVSFEFKNVTGDIANEFLWH